MAAWVTAAVRYSARDWMVAGWRRVWSRTATRNAERSAGPECTRVSRTTWTGLRRTEDRSSTTTVLSIYRHSNGKCNGPLNPNKKYANDEHALRAKLFGTYVQDMVPTANMNHTITVKFGLKITDINIDEYEGTFTVNTWILMKWNDFRLTWKPEEEGGVKKMRVRARSIWTPDITLYNSEEIDTVYDQRVKAIVEYDGNITWVPPEKLTVRCSLNIQRFPYDTHTCQLMFGSWTHDGYVVDIQLDDDFKKYNHSDAVFAYLHGGHFTGDDVIASRLVHRYPCCKEPYPIVLFTLTFSRRSSMYSRIFVSPCVLLGVLSSLIFLMPFKSGERTVLGVGVLICTLLLCIWVGYIFPGSLDDAPNILLYYGSVMIMTLIAICLAGLTTSMRENKQPPGDFLRRICIEKLSCIACVSTVNYQYIVEEHDSPDSFEPQLSLEEPAYTVSRPGKSLRIHHWQMIGTIMDRCLFVIHFAVTSIVAVALMKY